MTTRRYRLDPTNTFAAVIVKNDRSKLLSRLGHDHVIRAQEFTSTIVIDSDHLDALSFSLEFPVASLDVDVTEDREQVGLSGVVSEKDQRATRDNMLAKDQLDLKHHGNLHFHIKGSRPSAVEGELILLAGLTVKGRRHDFEFPVEFLISPNLQVSGKVEVSHRDLGMKPYRAPMGTLQNQEMITFVVDADVAPL